MRKYGLLLLGSLALLLCVKISFASPITGNLKGRVTLVEYYDYECPHCRRMETVIDHLEAAYPQLQVVHRATPLLTAQSRGIASIALAAKAQGQWRSVHQALMRLPNTPTITNTENIVSALGLNVGLLFKDAQQASIQKQLRQNIKLAGKYATNGAIYFPLLVFKPSKDKGQSIVLRGEQPYALLSAIVQQLSGEAHVQMVKQTHRRRKTRKNTTRKV